MNPPPILTRDAITVVETAVLQAVRNAFHELGTGRAVQPPQALTALPGGGDVIAYQAVLGGAGIHAIKVSPYLPQPEGKPVVTAWTLLMSTRTGDPLLLADSQDLTMERTAATTALAIDFLAQPDARTLAVIGTGPVGQAHLRYASLVRPFDDVRVFSRHLDPARAATFGHGTAIASSAEQAIDGADVVLLCTSAAQPVIDVSTIGPGVLVTSISTNAPLTHEIDPAALTDLDVYCDYSPAAVAAAGEMRIAVEQYGFSADAICGDLPGLVAGTAPTPSRERPVFFRSVGLGIEDAAVALAALSGSVVSSDDPRPDGKAADEGLPSEGSG